ncbi:MAG: N-formylglutamate amidohydrolase [Alphaproteobacteria bacterium]|nr:N-formylglutamate amidohydrolase [Alphaproteobacteria bacterium]
MPHLLSAKEPKSFRMIREKRDRSFLFVCDHASNKVPSILNHLGLPDSELGRHIGYDIGSARVTEILANQLGAAAILQNYSRLVIDCNRFTDEPSLIPEVSDGTIIPANINLSTQDKAARIAEIFDPYHEAIAGTLKRLEKNSPPVTVVAIHSFTPCLQQNGTQRPWQIGVLWRNDKESAHRLISFLQQHTTWAVGENEPYSMINDKSYTINSHAEAKGRPGLLIEIRQDEISTDVGQQRVAEVLCAFFDDWGKNPKCLR